MARRFNIKDIDENADNVERFSEKRKTNHNRRDRQEMPDNVKPKKHNREFIREIKGHGFPSD